MRKCPKLRPVVWESKDMTRAILYIIASCVAAWSTSYSAEQAQALLQAPPTLTGRWTIGDSGEILSISEGGRWVHPTHGVAKIRLGDDASDLTVIYEQSSTHCSYKIAFSERGQTLDLMAADLSQDADYCPEGNLTRVGSAGER